jgi:cyclophilin family peptidyl-prolyl cis-trans isomerase
VDVPQGALPKIDGAVEEAEWRGAARLRAEGGEAFLLASGRVLCVGVQVKRPYGGERIDLQVADELGKNYSSHAFHPACTIPPLSPYPIAPVIARRASFALRREAPLAPSVSCRFRARVYTEAESWSAEFAIALETLEVSPMQRIVFTLDVVHPAGETARIAFAPPLGEEPRQWQAISAEWPADAPPFLTPDEDRHRAFELVLFREVLGLVTQKPADERPVADAVQGRKSTGRIDDLVVQLDRCLAADPLDLFALATKASLLRRANRIADAWEAAEPMWRLEPGRASLLLAGTRRTLLIADARFDEAAAMDLPGRDEIRAMASAWDAELDARARDKGLPRIAFGTTRGRVVVEILERDAPKAAQALLAIVARGACTDVAFDEVTGSAFAQAVPQGAVRVDPEGTRRAWRGTLALAESGALLFRTGHDPSPAVGRIVEGMEAVDALDQGDRIESAEVLR